MSSREVCVAAAGEAIAAGLLRQAARSPLEAARHALPPGASAERVAVLAERIAADRALAESAAAVAS